jgi:hypothetical protein
MVVATGAALRYAAAMLEGMRFIEAG